MATLAEELRNVEAKIGAMEEATQFGSAATAAQNGSFLSPGDRVEAQWIEPSRANWMLVSATSSERSMTGRVSRLLDPQNIPPGQRHWLLAIRLPPKELDPLRGRHRVPKETCAETPNRKVCEGKTKVYGDVRGLFTSCALLSDRHLRTPFRLKSSLECKGRLRRMTQWEMDFRMFRAERRVV